MVFCGVVGCAGDSPVAPEPPEPANCRLGPIVGPPNSPGVACAAIAPGCPAARPASAQALIAVSTCGFRFGDSSCVPVQLPDCPRAIIPRVHFRLHNPNTDFPASTCTADVFARIEATENGGARIEWDAQELAVTPGGGCEKVGPEYEGVTTIAGPCCQGVVDIPLPKGRFTFRIVIRTDWQN